MPPPTPRPTSWCSPSLSSPDLVRQAPLDPMAPTLPPLKSIFPDWPNLSILSSIPSPPPPPPPPPAPCPPHSYPDHSVSHSDPVLSHPTQHAPPPSKNPPSPLPYQIPTPPYQARSQLSPLRIRSHPSSPRPVSWMGPSSSSSPSPSSSSSPSIPIPPSSPHSSSRPRRRRANPQQLAILNQVFTHTFFPTSELRDQLALELGMSSRTVQIWFQNKRQQWRSRKKSSSASFSEHHTPSPPPPPPLPPSSSSPSLSTKLPLITATPPVTPPQVQILPNPSSTSS
ncbi:MAG: hypothetical protein DHS80DRAFT_21063 [Piptocephalis tieghemiana]|nr:MAG: hypothetical protein DHS80DRAFT_21063 [Piptocephalis tieghemiana]